MIRTLHLVFLLTVLSACSNIRVSDYHAMQPAFSAETFFNGELSAHGVVKDRSGAVTRSFNANILAYWTNGVGTLEEDFIFNDGTAQRRVWTLTPNGEQRYLASAGDVVGDGVMKVSGNSAFLDYVLRIPYGDGTVDVRVDDRMYLVSEDVLVNESELTKFGIRVGSLLLAITRHTAAP